MHPLGPPRDILRHLKVSRQGIRERHVLTEHCSVVLVIESALRGLRGGGYNCMLSYQSSCCYCLLHIRNTRVPFLSPRYPARPSLHPPLSGIRGLIPPFLGVGIRRLPLLPPPSPLHRPLPHSPPSQPHGGPTAADVRLARLAASQSLRCVCRLSAAPVGCAGEVRRSSGPHGTGSAQWDADRCVSRHCNNVRDKLVPLEPFQELCLNTHLCAESCRGWGRNRGSKREGGGGKGDLIT